MTGCQTGYMNSRRRPALCGISCAAAGKIPHRINRTTAIAAAFTETFISPGMIFQRNQRNDSRLGSFHEIFLESPRYNCKRKSKTRQYATPQSIRCRDKEQDTESGCVYFTAMAPTRDSKILNPSVPPNSGSLERSGCGIIPSTFRPGLQIPAIFSRDPLGLAALVISPEGEQ